MKILELRFKNINSLYAQTVRISWIVSWPEQAKWVSLGKANDLLLQQDEE